MVFVPEISELKCVLKEVVFSDDNSGVQLVHRLLVGELLAVRDRFVL